MKLHLPTGLRAALIAALTAVGFTLTQASATTFADADLRLEDFNEASITAAQQQGWAFTDISYSESGIFTTTATQGTITNSNAWATVSGNRTLWSGIVTININSLGTSGTGVLLETAPNISTGSGQRLEGIAYDASGNKTLEAAWNGTTWPKLTVTNNLASFADDEGWVTVGVVYLGDGGTTVYVGGTKVNNSGLKGGYTGDGKPGIFLGDHAGIQYSRLYLFGESVSDADMTKMLTSLRGSVTWTGNVNSNWDTQTLNWVTTGSTTPDKFTKKADVNFGAEATVKEVNVVESVTATSFNVDGDYIFNVKEDKVLAADSLALGANATAVTINMAAGAATQIVGGMTLAQGKSLNLGGAGKASIASVAVAGGTFNVGSGLDVTGGGAGEGGDNSKGLALTGGNAVVNILDGTTKVTGAVYSNGNGVTLNVGTGEQDAVLVANRMELGDAGGGTTNFHVGQHGKVVVKSANDATGYKSAALLLSEWNQQVAASVEGKLYAKDAYMSFGDVVATVNVSGTLAVKGMRSLKNATANVVTLAENGKLILGEGGINSDHGGTWNITLNGGEMGIYANTTITRNLNVAGAVTFNTAMYTWSGEDAALELQEGTTGGTMTVSGNITGDGTIIKKGDGTLVFTGNNNAITHTIDLQAGTLDISAAVLDVSGISGGGMETTYSDGQNEGNGFATVSGSVDVVNINGGTLTRGDVQVKYNGVTYTMDENGDIVMSGTKSLTAFYVNKSGTTESLANAVTKGDGQLTTVILKDNTTLAADVEASLASLSVAEGASAVVDLSRNLNIAALTVSPAAVLTLDGAGTLAATALNIAADSALDIAGDIDMGTMALTSAETPAVQVLSGGILTISTASKVDNQGFVNGESGELAGTQAFTKTFKGLAVGVQDGGKLVLKGNVNAVEQGSSGGTYNMGVAALEIQGNLQLNTWNATTYAIGDNAMKVTGDAWFKNHQLVNMANGTLEVGGALRMAHEGNNAAGQYLSTLTATDGSTVTLGEIQFYGGHNEVNLNGSTLTFTKDVSNAVSMLGTNVPTQAVDLNKVNLTDATLKAETSSWSLTSTEGITVNLAGTTNLDVASGKTMTLGITTAEGGIVKKGAGTAVIAGTGTSSATIAVNEGTLKATTSNALGTGAVTVAADTTLELSVGDALGATQTVTNSGNVLIHKTLTSGTINGGTLTLASDFPVDGGGLKDVNDTSTGNGFSQGGTLHVYKNPAALTDVTSIVYGSQEYTLDDVDINGDITLGGAEWSIYQLNTANEDQPTIQEIMDYADGKTGTPGTLKQIVVTGEDLGIVNDSTTFKTSMLSGDQLDSFDIAMVDGSVLTMDADLAGGLVMGAATATDAATVVLEKDAEIGGSLFIYPFAEGGIGTLTVKGKYTLTTPLFGTMGGKLVLQDGATLATPAFAIEQGDSVTVKDTAALSLGDDNIRIQSVDGTKDASLTNVDGDAYDLNNAGHTLKDARITISYSDAAHDFGHTISGAVALVNDGTSSVRDINAANTAYDELAAQKGDIYLANKDSVSVRNLTLGAGRTVAAASATQPVAITVNGTASFGSGATVGAALTMAGGAKLDGTASLANHDLSLANGLILSDGLWDSIKGLTPGDESSKFDLFTNVSGLKLAGSTYTDAVDLTSIFTHGELAANKFNLNYDNGSVFVTRNADNDRYWKGGSDTWDYTKTNWTDEDGGSNYVAFQEGYSAYFTNATNGTVTLDTNITAASITVSGADYTFAPNSHTLTVTDSVTVTGAHTATFDMGLIGGELKLSAKDGGTLVLNKYSSVKSVDIGTGSTVKVAGAEPLAVAGNVVNNGTLETNATTSVTGDLSLGAESTVSGTGTVSAASVTLTGNTTVTGNLSTDALAGTSALRLDGGSLTFTAANDLTGKVHLITNGSTTITSEGVTLKFKDSVENISGTVTFVGQFDVGNCTTVDGDAVYVGGDDTANGFKKAQKIVSVITAGTANDDAATLTYNGTSIGNMNDQGKVTFDGDTEYDKFYVNKSGTTEKASTALDNPKQKLGTFELADNTTLEVDKNISMSMVNVAADKSATMQIDSGSTVTTDGTTKALTLKGAGTLAVDSGKTATGVTLDNTWTGTVSFTEAELATLDGAWKSGSTVSLTGVTGSLGSTPIGAAVILNKGTGDWGFGQTATGTQVVTLNGAITGDGNLGVKSGTEDSTFNLNGDINGWNGNFIVATDADTTLNLGGSGAKTVNGTVSGTNLEVNVNADTTFSGALNVEKLTVGTSKAATLKADSTVNEVNASNGSLKVDDGKTLTVTANALPKGLKLGAGSTIKLVDDAYMRGEGNYAYYGGTVANGTDLEQAMGFNNADITVTGTTLGVNGGPSFTVDNKLVNATLDVENGLPSTVILNNVQDSLEVAGDLEIGPSGLLKVANGSSKQTLNISGGTTLTLADSTTLDADLTLNSGATLRLDYNMSSPVATSLESGALTLASGLTLSGDLYTQIEGMEDTGSFVNLFKGVGALTLGESAYSEPVKAQLYFSNMEDLDEKGDYWLEYNADTDIVSIRFEATSAHTLTWNGTATEHRWVQDDDTVTDWLEGNPAASAYFQEGDNAKFTADAAEKTVTIEQDITARNITIDSPDCYTFENSDDYSITAQKFEMTGHDGLAKTGEGKLTLDIIGDVSLTESALMVQEGSLEIGTAAKSGKLDLQASALEIAEDAELSVASIEGDGTSSIELAGTMTVSEGTVSNLTATEGSLLKIADLGQTTAGTLSVDTDTTLYGLENGGTLDLGNKTLNLMEQTEQGGNVTAGKLNLAENGNEFKELGTNRVTYAYGSEGSGQLDADAPNLVVDSIAPTMVIPSIALDVTEAMGDGGSLGAINRLGDEVTYTLIHANNQALVAGGFTLVGEALLIQNGLLHADSGLWSDGNNLNLTVGGLDLAWYTSNDETEWGYQVMSGDALTDGANTLNGVQHVLVDEDRTVDVTGVGSEPGLRVRNLAGLDGSTITFSGEEGDTVNLITTEETASNVNLAAENITVKVGLDELDGMDPEDYKDLRVGDVDLTGATLAVHSYEDLDAAFTVNTLSGDDESTLKGRVIVEGQGGEYFGGYENAYVILHENAEQTLAAGEGLTVAGLGAAKLAYVGPETHMDGIEGINMTVTLNDPKQDNSGATLVLDKPSWLVDGTIISGMSAIKSGATLDTAEAPNLIQAAGLNLDGTTIILNQDAADDSAMAMTVNALGKTKGLYLAHLGAEDSNTDRVLLNGYLYNKYYQNARLERGMLLVDRRDAFFTEDVVRPTTVNGRAGAGMLDDALLEINPQATNPQGDLAAVMTALETNAVANPDRVAAAVAGASAAALGHAFNNDVQRQLRAIRNRTTTMGLAECVKHEGLPYVNAWVNAEGDYRKLDADGTLAGYTLSSWGGTIGCDVDLTGRLTVGAAFTVLHGEFTSHSADMCEGDLDRDYVSLFARYGYRAWTHTFVATLGFAKSKVDRTVNYGTGSYTTRGDSDGNAFGFLYEVGYTKALNEDASTCLQPIFNVNYRHSSLGGYTEKGGSDAALSVGSADMDAVTFGLGARLQSIVGTSVYNRATLFEGRVLAKLDAGDRDCTTNSSLIGVSAKRSVKSAEVGAFGVEVGAGLTIPVGETGGSIFMDVTGDFRSGYTEFNGTVGYRFSF